MPNANSAHSTRRTPALLFTVPEVADALQVSKRTVESLIASGQLESVTIGRARRVYEDDLRAFASRGTAEIVKSGLKALAASGGD